MYAYKDFLATLYPLYILWVAFWLVVLGATVLPQPGTTWDNSATTRLEWDGLGLLIRSFRFGVTYRWGKGGKLLWPSY